MINVKILIVKWAMDEYSGMSITNSNGAHIQLSFLIIPYPVSSLSQLVPNVSSENIINAGRRLMHDTLNI